ncbi:hypothetical protein BH23CHL5_BH23CHL5_14780 [soil metagenome]
MAETLTLDQRLPTSIDEMRTAARERFKERVLAGGLGAGCECHDESSPQTVERPVDSEYPCVAGVRFIDSGQVYYFDAADHSLQLNDWILVETQRGREAAKVVIAPSQVAKSQISGELRPIIRVLSEDDVRTMNRMRRESATAVRTFSAKIREHRLRMKPISAEYNFDGTELALSFSAPERVDFRELARDLAASMKCRVELRQVGQRDEARLLGGVGKCGRTLCCATWLPMFPEINMGLAKTQDLSLNPGKVSGVCGRLLCCLSYENEQYKQMKAVMPKLGQIVPTPRGDGMVVAMQILKDLVTVRLPDEGADAVFPAEELGFGSGQSRQTKPAERRQDDDRRAEVSEPQQELREPKELAPSELPIASDGDPPAVEGQPRSPQGKRRRRRRGRGSGGGNSNTQTP